MSFFFYIWNKYPEHVQFQKYPKWVFEESSDQEHRNQPRLSREDHIKNNKAAYRDWFTDQKRHTITYVRDDIAEINAKHPERLHTQPNHIKKIVEENLQSHSEESSYNVEIEEEQFKRMQNQEFDPNYHEKEREDIRIYFKTKKNFQFK